VIGEERFLDLLFLRRADHIVKNAGIVVDVAIVNVVGQLDLVLERLALIAHPLRDDEAAECDQRAQGGKRRLHVLVLDAGTQAEIKADYRSSTVIVV
jgi:hypothetical protein